LLPITVANRLNERHQLATEVIAGLYRHLCGQVVDTVKQDVMLSHLSYLLFKLRGHCVVK